LVTFRQVYWGAFGDNSYLEKLAAQFMPKGVPYKIELTVLGGKVYEKGVTKQGRSSVKRAVKEAQNTNSSSIKKLVALVKKKRKDGEKEDEETN
jgi:hypothetical protein